KNSMQNFLALAPGLLRKREFQVAHAHPPQLAMQRVNRPCNGNPRRAGQWSRQRTHNFQQSPGEGVFESVAQSHADGSTREILMSNLAGTDQLSAVREKRRGSWVAFSGRAASSELWLPN